MESRNDQRQQYTLRVGGSSARWGWVAAVPAAGGWAGGRGGYRGGRVVGMHLDEQGQGPWAHWGAGCAGTCTTSGIACFASGGLLPSLSVDAEIHLLKPAHPLAAPAMAPHNHTHHPSIHPPTTTSHPHCQPPHPHPPRCRAASARCGTRWECRPATPCPSAWTPSPARSPCCATLGLLRPRRPPRRRRRRRRRARWVCGRRAGGVGWLAG